MRARDKARLRGQAALAAGIFVALIATTLPVTRVIAPGAWVAGGLGLAALLLAAGVLLRRLGLVSLGATGVELVIWTFVVTAGFFSESAWGGVVPSPETLRAASTAIATAMQEMAVGAAPLPATEALSFFIVAAIGALAIVLDHVVLTTRMPLLGAVALLAVAIVPTIAVPAPMDVFAFVLLAISILFLLRTDTRTRPGRGAARSPAASVGAAAIAVAAVTAAVIVTPLLPTPAGGAIASGGMGSTGINPTLRLGDDLRRPNPVEVLRVNTSQSRAPYLRAVTLSSFDGDVWRQDEPASTPLGEGLGPVLTDPAVTLTDAATHIEVRQLNTVFLPVPFPATEVTGLAGDWALVPENRTVIGIGSNTNGQTYDVATTIPTPSLEQIRAATSRQADVDDALRAIPAETPPIVTELAQQVTADTSTDYDAAAALQRWFRSAEFRYSLQAPVEDGFDGAGVDAVARFLEVRAGYCTHYASAFAVMARSLGMPTRIVIGYLPGVGTSDRVDDELVYSVTSDLLHAWPEVYFEGIGWVPFEPTNSLGSPTTFSSSAGSGVDRLGQTPAPTAAQPTASSAPSARPDATGAPQAGGGAAGTGAGAVLPTASLVLALLVALAVPAGVRALWRRRQLAAAAEGDERAAWTLVQDAAIDLAIPVPSSSSPRAFGAQLVAHGAPADAVQVLVTAIEHASFAPADAVAPGRTRTGRPLAAAAASVRAALLADAPPARRVLAIVAPRSLVVRPGSDAAGAVSR